MREEDLPPPPRAPPALPDVLVEEILLRSLPDDPARLVRAALLCKRWARLVSARAFHRRFRDFHLQRRGAPMLGFLHNKRGPNGALSTGFVRTSASCPPVDTSAAGSRSTRAAAASSSTALTKPLAASSSTVATRLLRGFASPSGTLPLLLAEATWSCPSPSCRGTGPSGTLRCSAATSTDSRTTPAGPSASYWWARTATGPSFASYSSIGPAAWSEPAYATLQPGRYFVDAVRGALIGNTLYFLFQIRTMIFKYDLATGDMSVIQLPPESHSGHTVLTNTEDGSLGFARVKGNKLCLWSMEAMPNGDAVAMEWTQGRVIDLRSLLPDISLLGFADGLDKILVGTMDGFFSRPRSAGAYGTGYALFVQWMASSPLIKSLAASTSL